MPGAFHKKLYNELQKQKKVLERLSKDVQRHAATIKKLRAGNESIERQLRDECPELLKSRGIRRTK